jgi:ferrochelatase
MDWAPRFLALAGWHYHPDYVSLRARNVSSFVDDSALDLNDSDTLLYFSAHGTPLRYLRENRYDRYVFEHCRDVARALGSPRYAVGFQNHTNRGIPWTRPDNEDRLREVEERRVVVVPISFLKEQSETLAELDHALRDFALGRGKEFHRVPVPHDDAALRVLLADLVCALLSGDPAAGGSLRRCRCCPGDGTWCTNGLRDPPPSPASPQTEVDS